MTLKELYPWLLYMHQKDSILWYLVFTGPATFVPGHTLLITKSTNDFPVKFHSLVTLIFTSCVCIVFAGTRRCILIATRFQKWKLIFMVHSCVPDSIIGHVQIYYLLLLIILWSIKSRFCIEGIWGLKRLSHLSGRDVVNGKDRSWDERCLSSSYYVALHCKLLISTPASCLYWWEEGGLLI